MSAGRGVLYTTGTFTAHVMAVNLDPTLEHLNWRLCFIMTIPPTLILLLLTSLLLYESPVYSACIGEHKKAQLAFQDMRQTNSRPEVSISYKDSGSTVADRTPTGDIWDHMRVIFAVGMIGCTMTLVITCASSSLFGGGHGYGLPRVLIEESDKHNMMPGTQLVIECAWGYTGCLMMFAMDLFLSRKRMIMVMYGLFTISFTTFAWSAHSGSKFWLVVIAVQASLAVLRIVLKMCSLTLYLACTECYPTALLATGTAFCMGIGRVASIAAPFVFEWFHMTTGLVTSFYYACSAIALLNVFVLSAFLPEDLETAKTRSTEFLNVILNRKKDLT